MAAYTYTHTRKTEMQPSGIRVVGPAPFHDARQVETEELLRWEMSHVRQLWRIPLPRLVVPALRLDLERLIPLSLDQGLLPLDAAAAYMLLYCRGSRGTITRLVTEYGFHGRSEGPIVECRQRHRWQLGGGWKHEIQTVPEGPVTRIATLQLHVLHRTAATVGCWPEAGGDYAGTGWDPPTMNLTPVVQPGDVLLKRLVDWWRQPGTRLPRKFASDLMAGLPLRAPCGGVLGVRGVRPPLTFVIEGSHGEVQLDLKGYRATHRRVGERLRKGDVIARRSERPRPAPPAEPLSPQSQALWDVADADIFRWLRATGARDASGRLYLPAEWFAPFADRVQVAGLKLDVRALDASLDLETETGIGQAIRLPTGPHAGFDLPAPGFELRLPGPLVWGGA